MKPSWMRSSTARTARDRAMSTLELTSRDFYLYFYFTLAIARRYFYFYFYFTGKKETDRTLVQGIFGNAYDV